MTLSLGTVLHDRYRIDQPLTQGGFGAIYRAWDTSLSRTCALKENLDTSPEAQRQFEREAKILADLSHPHLPRVSDYFFISGQGQYLVMDYVEGQDLQEILEQRGVPLDESQALNWICQVCDALAYLHNQTPPVIHRDIKPANIQITADGNAVLVDFGIAKVYDPGLKTTIGAQAVTPGYSPIEQYGSDTTDARSDIYALGATLYTLLTGVEPPESVKRVVRDPLTPAEQLNPALSPGTQAALRKALQVDPQQRFQQVLVFKAALRGVGIPSPGPASAPPQPITTRSKFPWVWIGLFAGLLLVLVVLMWLSQRTGPGSPPGDLPTQAVQLGDTESASATPVGEAAVPSTTVPPATSTLQPFSAPRVHVVEAGDTCTQIAQQYGVWVNDLIALNHTSIDCPILVGQKLLIPSRRNIDPTTVAPSPTQISPLDGMPLVYIPAGIFWMGAASEDLDASSDEMPGHWVYLDAFWIDRTEVTNAMYALCVKAGVCKQPLELGSKTRPSYYGVQSYADYPVIHVTWGAAREYCRWVGGNLPTEAQWEKAARGWDDRRFPWGDAKPDGSRLNYNNQVGDTTVVGGYLDGTSGYDTLDMAGNVSEWVLDWYDEDYYRLAPVDNPTGPVDGEFRVIRGGSWFSPARSVRTSFRHWNLPDKGFDSSGFRCVRSP